MNALGIMQSSYWAIAGWTMLHFLWIGSLVALVAALGRITLRRAAPQIRYAYALLCFAVLGASPVAIAVWVAPEMPREVGSAHVADASGEVVEQTAWMPLDEYANPKRGELEQEGGCHGRLVRPCPSVVREAPEPYSLGPLAGATDGLSASASAPHGQQAARGTRDGARAPIQWSFHLAALAVALLPWLWIAGTPITLAMLLAGFVGAERLRRQSGTLQQSELAFLCDGLCQSLAIARHVTIGVCDRIGSPIVLGIVKPMILLPPAALAGWSPEQLEMVLLHELAHVRRWDNLVNLLQRLVESLLFFHPAVWVTSAWVRAEREHCCDAVVVAHTGRPEAYAETLASLAGANVRPWATATAMAERNLTARIRRLLNLEDPAMQVSFNKLGFVIGICAAAALIVMSYAQEPSGDGPSKKAPASSIDAVVFDGGDEEPVLADVAVVEEAEFSDAVAAEYPALVDEQWIDRKASDMKERLQALLREREDYKSQLRHAEAKLVRLEQLLAERGSRAAQQVPHPDNSSAQAEKFARLLNHIEGDSTALQEKLSHLEAVYKRPDQSQQYQLAQAQLKALAAEKARVEEALQRAASSSQGTSDKQRRVLESIEHDRALVAEEYQRSLRSLESQRREAQLEHDARMETLRKRARNELDRQKLMLGLMSRSRNNQGEQNVAAVHAALEWLRMQIEKSEKEVEAPEDGRMSLLDADESQYDRARELYKKAEASFRKSADATARLNAPRRKLLRRPRSTDDVVDPSFTAPRPEPRDEDRGRLERLEREMRELKQMIRALQEAVTSRATSALPRPASQAPPAQPVPGAGPARPAIAPRSPGAKPQLPPVVPRRTRPAGPTLVPQSVVPPGAAARADKPPMAPSAKPAQRPAYPAEPKPSAAPEPARPPKSSSEPAVPPDIEPPEPPDEPAEPLDIPDAIEP